MARPCDRPAPSRALWATASSFLFCFFRYNPVPLLLFATMVHPAQSLQPGGPNRLPTKEKLAEVHWESPWRSSSLWSFAEPTRAAGEVARDYTSGQFFMGNGLNEWRRRDPNIAYSRQADSQPYSPVYWEADAADWASPTEDDYDDSDDDETETKSWWSYLMQGLSFPRTRVT